MESPIENKSASTTEAKAAEEKKGENEETKSLEDKTEPANDSTEPDSKEESTEEIKTTSVSNCTRPKVNSACSTHRSKTLQRVRVKHSSQTQSLWVSQRMRKRKRSQRNWKTKATMRTSKQQKASSTKKNRKRQKTTRIKEMNTSNVSHQIKSSAKHTIWIVFKYSESIEWYTEAIFCKIPNETKAIYYCNRSLANLRMENTSIALNDACECLKLDPTNVKGYYRKG